MAFPASVGHFDLPLMWSIVFFIMILLMGLSTMLTLVETVVTAILDEFPLLRTKSWCRAVVLTLVCCVLYTAGLPLTSQVRFSRRGTIACQYVIVRTYQSTHLSVHYIIRCIDTTLLMCSRYMHYYVFGILCTNQ